MKSSDGLLGVLLSLHCILETNALVILQVPITLSVIVFALILAHIVEDIISFKKVEKGPFT